MAEMKIYPQVPSTLWWGVRSIFQRTPNATITERGLSADLKVKQSAARQYIYELRRTGILDNDNKASPLGQKWRRDETYASAVKDILAHVYPEGLVRAAPPGSADRQKVIAWLAREGLSIATAGNKASTYLLLGSGGPDGRPAIGAEAPRAPAARTERSANGAPAAPEARAPKASVDVAARRKPSADPIPWNVNIQIQIGADTSGEQIEAIFSAMGRHLRGGHPA